MKTQVGFAGVFGHFTVLVATASLCCAIVTNAVAAPSAPATQAEQSAATAEPVFTRARLVSVQPDRDGRLLVRLKLLPRAKLPFSTLTFTVRDRALVADIPEGAWVKFTARSVEGENLLTAIHVVEECRRFQPCD
jgi:Cu/Ag efflux protein CusF